LTSVLAKVSPPAGAALASSISSALRRTSSSTPWHKQEIEGIEDEPISASFIRRCPAAD
jgi:hypothetical protein